MARPLRIEYNGAFYHVTSRGNERKRIFYAKSDYEKFKSNLEEAQEKYGFLLHCYVLMTNHYHLTIETPNGNLSKVMHYINASYTNYINRKRRRSGHLFQGRYRAILVDQEAYLLELSRYLHLNPVRANLVAKPEDYSYSSYRCYISGKKEEIISRDLILTMMSKNYEDAPRCYKEFVEQGIGVKLESPLKNVCGGVILGGQPFIKGALSRLEETVLQQEDISDRRQLQTALRSEDVIGAISDYFQVARDALFENNDEYRNLAIYLMKRYTGMTNRQIGRLFGQVSYSAVAKAHQRFSMKLAQDRSLQKKIREITASMSHVKT